MNATTWADIGAGIAGACGTPFAIESRAPVAGGYINKCYRVAGAGRAYFVKVNSAGQRAMFEAEAAGLAEIAATATSRVPAPLCAGANAEAAWLVVEYIEFGEATTRSMAQFGEALAAQHRVTAAKFGWTRDNTIGSTPQLNPQNADWISFWRDCRLGYQLDLASRNGAPAALLTKGARLAGGFAALFANRSVKPALLHGDLWGGNAGFDRAGAPVIFDPAVYYGDREADLAMTELFRSRL